MGADYDEGVGNWHSWTVIQTAKAEWYSSALISFNQRSPKATLNRSLIFIRVSHAENSTHQFNNYTTIQQQIIPGVCPPPLPHLLPPPPPTIVLYKTYYYREGNTNRLFNKAKVPTNLLQTWYNVITGLLSKEQYILFNEAKVSTNLLQTGLLSRE